MDPTRHAIRKLYEADDGVTPRIRAHRVGTTLVIDYFDIPEEFRGQGYGRRAYEEWEAGLPTDFKRIDLCAVDAGAGNSSPFWEAMGFDWKYDASEWDDPETACWMWKGINGHPTPPQIPMEDTDFEAM